MAVIKLQSFGGELPSASARALPATAARTSRNLLPTINEFRPLASDSVAATSGVSNPKTLYRMSRGVGGAFNTNMATGWIVNANEVNFVKGQIDDDLTERTYYTFGDGSAAPRAVNVNGVDRLLGVPPPAKPAVTHNVINEYTVDEDVKARIDIPIEIFNDIKASLSGTLYGNAPTPAPSAGAFGWLAHGTATTPALPTTNNGEWAFMAPMVAGAAGGYVMQYPEQANFLLATEFAGKQVAYGANQYWAIPVHMQAIGYTINATTLGTAFKAIVNPATGAQLVENANADAAAANFAALYLPTEIPHKANIEAVNAAQAALAASTTAPLNQTPLTDTIKAFYSKTDVAAEITAAIANFAKSVVASEASINYWPIENPGGL